MMEPEPTFEADLARLERIVGELENGKPDLADALARYEEGVKLLARCHGLLDQAERSVALLSGIDAEGQPVTTPFDPETPPEPPPAPRAPRKRPAPKESKDEPFIPF